MVDYDSCSLTIEAFVAAHDANAWDVYAGDDLNGPILVTLENAKGRWIRSELHGLGEGGFTINRHAPESTEDNFAEGNMVKVRIKDCGPDYIDGFFLPEEGDYTLLSGQGGQGQEDLVFRGLGALSYLDRARMLPCSFSLEDITGTWTKVWVTTAIDRPAGAAFDSAEPGYVYVGGFSSRKIRKLDQSTLAVVSSSPALWADSSKRLAGISFDPDDSSIVWVLQAPWLSGSGADTKILKVDRATWAILNTYSLGSAVKLTDIRVDGDYVWTTRYDNNEIQQRSKTTPTTISHHSTITYKGKVQQKPNGIAINGTKVAYWFGGDGGGGTGRALIADTSAYTTITGVQNTTNVSAFGGEWTTESGEDFLYAVSYTAGKTWKYQLTDAAPRCADDSGTFHPDQVAPGAIAWRVLVEITHPDRPSHPVPDLTYDFTETADSNGTTWPARTSTEEFTWRVGDRAYSDVLARLIPAGVTFDLDVNTMTLHAYVDADFGTDRTSASFGAGKVRFVEAINLAVNGDLERRDNRGSPATYITVAGDGGVYGDATLSGRYVREGFLQVSGPATEAVLDAIGDDELARERLISDALGFETLWDDDESVGRYIPKKHYWKGDLVRVDMTAGEFAYDETDFRVYGTLITERDGRNVGADPERGWRSALDLGSAYKVPEPITDTGGGQTGSGSGAGGGSPGGTGSTVITSIPLTFETEDGSVVVPRVTKVIADGISSPDAGVVVLPSGTAEVDPPLAEELPTAETDTSLVLHPDGTGGTEWGTDAGGADLGWYDISQYLVGDDSTDNAAAMIALLDLATASGTRSCTLFDSAGGIYRFDGAFQDTGAFNAIVPLPDVSTSDPQVTITFRGHVRPPMHPIGSAPDETYGYTIFKTTRTDGSGTAAVFSGGNGSFPTKNNIQVNIFDLICLNPDNPTQTFWNLSTTQGGQRGGLLITVDTWSTASEPTHSNAYGIKYPQWGQSNTSVTVDDVMVGGHYTGHLQGELNILVAVAGLCKVAVELPFAEHPSTILSLQQTACTYGIKVTGDHKCDVHLYAAEHYTSPAWADTVYDLDDGSDHLYGNIRWWGVAVGGSDDHVFDVNGAANATYSELGQPFAGSAIADILDIPTSETDATLVLGPDGAGGVEFRAETGGSGRWELAVIAGSPPDPLYADGDYLYILVP